MTVIINVPTVGTIRVRRGYGEYRTTFGVRVDHTVTFEPINGERVRYLVSSPVLRSGVNPFLLYGTISAAISFLDADETARNDGSDTAQAWMGCTEVPIGRVTAHRDEYWVTPDGNGGSDRMGGVQRRTNLRVTRGYDESAGAALMRALRGWEPWQGAGAFDAARDLTGRDPWRTVPVEGPEERYGVPCVGHTVMFIGEGICRSLDEISRELKREGQAW